ncbi:MAG: twin transmembrane helix small protein [Caulobacteraceae bacterium]
MEIFVDILIAIGMVGVVASLGMGVYAMLRGGEYGLANSNKFMQWRVKMQFATVILIVIGFILKSHPH